jgi:hypothetical protein
MSRTLQQFSNEARMQSVAGAIGNQPAEYRLANQREVAQ